MKISIVLFVGLGLAATPALAESPRSNAGPKIVTSFDAASGEPGMTYKDHPDMALAACSACGKGGQVLVVTGQDAAVYDTSGKLLKTQTTSSFLAAAGVTPGKVNDPRATFDPFIGRWIVVCSCSSDFLVVSENRDATGRWKAVALSQSSGDITMFPGWDRNGVYVSEFELPLNSLEFALPAADVAWTGDGAISLAHEGHFSHRPFETRPAVDPNPKKKPSEPEYLIARSGPPQNGVSEPMDLIVERIAWSGTTATVGEPINLPTGFFYSKPASINQPAGPDIRGVESHRVFSVAAHGRTLDVVEASGPCMANCGSQGEDTHNLFFWFQVDLDRMAISQKAKIAHPDLGYLFPTLAVDGRGNVAVAATGGSAMQYPSAYLFTHLTSDGANTINGPFLAQRGTQSYTCPLTSPQLLKDNVIGWGTYSATVQDASDPMKLWTLQEYGGDAAPCVWKTRVIGFEIAPHK